GGHGRNATNQRRNREKSDGANNQINGRQTIERDKSLRREASPLCTLLSRRTQGRSTPSNYHTDQKSSHSNDGLLETGPCYCRHPPRLFGADIEYASRNMDER